VEVRLVVLRSENPPLDPLVVVVAAGRVARVDPKVVVLAVAVDRE
jgi:hypothetical protein